MQMLGVMGHCRIPRGILSTLNIHDRRAGVSVWGVGESVWGAGVSVWGAGMSVWGAGCRCGGDKFTQEHVADLEIPRAQSATCLP